MARDSAGSPIATPYSKLLISNCVGCHSSSTSSTILNGAPIVNNQVAPVNILAGGNFYYVGTDDSFGHNVAGISAIEAAPMDAPPGGSFPAGGTYTGQLRCAGTRGCHGQNGGHAEAAVDDQLQALAGSHHANLTPIDGTTVGKSYRFLNGILGKEDANWEQDNINTSHNEYQGSTAFTTDTTIGFLCAECHGDYHSTTGVGSASPWLRHPTDIALNATGEYAGYTVYSMTAPVARPDPNTVADTTQVTPGIDIVMCLSCHRAHGSPGFKITRWDYKSATLATALSGCGVCHTSKN
jgi:predicted CXXCH cytochrome family protein